MQKNNSLDLIGTEKQSILVLDDDNYSRKGLCKILFDLNWFSEIEELSSYNKLSREYDIIIINQNANWLKVISEIKKVNQMQKIIALLLVIKEQLISELLALNVNGIILKSSPIEQLIKCIEMSKENKGYFSEEISNLFMNLWANNKLIKNEKSLDLSDRETEVLQSICNQKTNDEIAKELFLSSSSVKKYRCNLLEKTKSKTSAGLILFAIKNGIYKI